MMPHCAKVQKYEQGKIGLQFFICDTNNVVEHYAKKIKILHRCPFEGMANSANQPISAKKGGMALPC